MTTRLLSPLAGVRLAWAMTGKFSTDEKTRLAATMAEQALKPIQTQAAQDPKEHQYLLQAVGAIEASLRSLDIITKGRELNFEENEKLRAAYMENVKENIEFGSKARDLLRSLPTMAITGAGGVITFGPSLATWLQIPNTAIAVFLGVLALGFAGAGHLIYAGIVRAMQKRTQMLYVQQDYERNLYYEQYVSRSTVVLTSLYLDLDRIHEAIFGQSYPVSDGGAIVIVEDLLKGVRSPMCKYAHKHMRNGVITPALWTLCETGGDPATLCRYWEG